MSLWDRAGPEIQPIVCTTDPSYREISRRFQENPKAFELAFAKARFKLTHRDMGPRARYIGSGVPAEELIWQDPVPVADYKMIDAGDIEQLKSKILASGLTTAELVETAWASASSYRGTDMRGGANGAASGGKQVSLAELLDMSTEWKKSPQAEGVYEGRDRVSGKVRWTATPVVLIFGSSSELRAVAEVYAADDGQEKFVADFVDAWTKVMTLDSFDLKGS